MKQKTKNIEIEVRGELTKSEFTRLSDFLKKMELLNKIKIGL